MKQGLYAQVVMLHLKYLKTTEANINKNDDKFKFQGQSARSHCWFDIDFHWIPENFITHKPDLYKKIYQRHEETQDTNKFKMFEVPIGNTKCVEETKFQSMALMLKYRQNSLNSCCFSSLASAFDSINQTKASNYIGTHTEESLTIKVVNHTDYSNAILKNQKKLKVNRNCIIA